jgi:hypothetical protein
MVLKEINRDEIPSSSPFLHILINIPKSYSTKKSPFQTQELLGPHTKLSSAAGTEGKLPRLMQPPNALAPSSSRVSLVPGLRNLLYNPNPSLGLTGAIYMYTLWGFPIAVTAAK